MCILLQVEVKEKEHSSMHITVPTSEGKVRYTVPVLTTHDSSDVELTVDINPSSSVNTSVSSTEFVHVVNTSSEVLWMEMTLVLSYRRI